MTQRAALYARYSSDQQSAASVDDQLRLCRVRADREGWTIVCEHVDRAISGTVRDRPGLRALLVAMEKGRIDLVLVESLDRLSRDLEHVASIHKSITFHGGRIVTLAEGEVTDLHVGLRGTMGALFLKDLAAKTHRGLEGRIRKGRAVGNPPYGYRVVRKLGANGEIDRGLRQIDETEAAVVRRIFQSYAAGASPLQIARALNADAIPGPSGGAWLQDTIRGRDDRRDGILRNPLYDGRLVWNRRRNLKDPATGSLVRRGNAQSDHVEIAVEELRIVDAALWQAAQARLRANAASQSPRAPSERRPGFWDRRRPRHLLSGKVFCGSCGHTFAAIGKDYLRCIRARNGHCDNCASLRRIRLEHQVMDALATRLMAPGLLDAFREAFAEEWAHLVGEAQVQATAHARQRSQLERRIANLVDALSESPRSPGLKDKLMELEQQLAGISPDPSPSPDVAPLLPRNLSNLYQARLAELRSALTVDPTPEVLETTRALIDRVTVLGPNGNGRPRLDLEGNLPSLISFAACGTPGQSNNSSAAQLRGVVERSIKRGPGSRTLVGVQGAKPPGLAF